MRPRNILFEALSCNNSELYEQVTPGNYIYYRQSLGDQWHFENHAKPLMAAMSVASGGGVSDDGRYRFIAEQGERFGHGNVTPREFNHHFNAATEWWRLNRKRTP